MKRIVGIVIAVLYAVLAGLAFGNSTGSWGAGNADLGFWWSVIACLLAIAGTGALLGSWIHTRPQED